MVEWLQTNVEGFIDRRHARKYSALMLKHNFIRHTVNKITFSEQCYYIFGDFKAAANSLPSGEERREEWLWEEGGVVVGRGGVADPEGFSSAS